MTMAAKPNLPERVSILLEALGIDAESFRGLLEWVLAERLVSELASIPDVRELVSPGAPENALARFRERLQERTHRRWSVHDARALFERVREESRQHFRDPVPLEDALLLRLRDPLRCRRCGREPPVVRLHIDHVVPASKGGGSRLGNLQFLCETCNREKSNKREVTGSWLDLT
jgi:5-methylcytosine-specific restriction protein A